MEGGVISWSWHDETVANIGAKLVHLENEAPVLVEVNGSMLSMRLGQRTDDGRTD